LPVAFEPFLGRDTMRVVTAGILVALIVSLCACAGEPTRQQNFESPLTTPSAESTALAEPSALPSPQSGKGTVIGQFVDRASGEPVADKVIYLGELTAFEEQDGEAPSSFVMMVPSQSPSASTDQDGHFAFVDVDPGTYVFVLWTPVDSWVVVDPETEENILVTVQPGEVLDMGVVPIHPTR
jgi:hypothetical protein